MQFIDLNSQHKLIEDKVKDSLNDIFTNSRYIMGSEVTEIENRLAEFTEAKHAIACASGTDALQIALMALDLKAGDEVITTPFTFFATGEVIALLGLKPVFVDIERKSYNINPELIEDKITNRTKAIIPVSLYGQCANMDKINAIAQKHGITVIEDAAQSFGAEYKDRKSCNLSEISTTSFFPSKPLGCYGDGGMVFTNNDKIADKLRMIRNHGQEQRYHHPILGVNSRLDTMQAAVLLAKMDIFANEVESRKRIGARYSKLLSDFVKTPIVLENQTHIYAQYTIEVDNREQFCASMKDLGIPTAVHYPVPLHFQPVFKDVEVKEGELAIAEEVAQKVVSLPMHPYLDEETQDKVIEGVKKCLQDQSQGEKSALAS